MLFKFVVIGGEYIIKITSSIIKLINKVLRVKFVKVKQNHSHNNVRTNLLLAVCTHANPNYQLIDPVFELHI